MFKDKNLRDKTMSVLNSMAVLLFEITFSKGGKKTAARKASDSRT